MKSLRRIRHSVAVFGMSISAILVVLWAISVFWQVDYVGAAQPGGCGIASDACRWQLAEGMLRYDSWTSRYGFGSRSIGSGRGLSITVSRPGPGFKGPEIQIGGLGVAIYLPIWMLLVITVIPTGVLFWSDGRRARPGCCRCGYDLTGNASGVCPECGEQVRPGAKADR